MSNPKADASHLRPWLWQPGKSGNPAGRPKKGDAWADIIAEIMEEVASELAGVRHPSKRKVRMVIVRKMAIKAMRGDIRAAQWLADRESGKPYQRGELDIEGLNLGPVILPVKEGDVESPDPDNGD